MFVQSVMDPMGTLLSPWASTGVVVPHTPPPSPPQRKHAMMTRARTIDRSYKELERLGESGPVAYRTRGSDVNSLKRRHEKILKSEVKKSNKRTVNNTGTNVQDLINNEHPFGQSPHSASSGDAPRSVCPTKYISTPDILKSPPTKPSRPPEALPSSQPVRIYTTDEYRLQGVTTVYTDGSYDHAGTGGGGVYFGPRDPRNMSLKFKPCSDAYDSEYRALNQALAIISKEIEKFKTERSTFLVSKYEIASDHLGLVSRIQWTPLYLDISLFYNSHSVLFNGHKFRVKWVKGHSGIPGNVAADQLATQGRLMAERPVAYPRVKR